MHSAREFYETCTAECLRNEIAQITEIQARGVIIRFWSLPKSGKVPSKADEKHVVFHLP